MKFGRCDLTLSLITLFGSLSIVDIVTTTYILQQGGRELNLFLVPFVHDPTLFFVIKGLGLFIIIGLAGFSRLIMRDGDNVVLATCCMMSIFPAVWNTVIIWGM